MYGWLLALLACGPNPGGKDTDDPDRSYREVGHLTMLAHFGWNAEAGFALSVTQPDGSVVPPEVVLVWGEPDWDGELDSPLACSQHLPLGPVLTDNPDDTWLGLGVASADGVEDCVDWGADPAVVGSLSQWAESDLAVAVGGPVDPVVRAALLEAGLSQEQMDRHYFGGAFRFGERIASDDAWTSETWGFALALDGASAPLLLSVDSLPLAEGTATGYYQLWLGGVLTVQ